MDKLDFQKLMEQTFKSNFIINLLTKLYSKEISKEDYIKLLNEKKSEITRQNPSFTEIQRYHTLMTLNEEKIVISTSSTNIVETKDKFDNNKIKFGVLLYIFTIIYILFFFIYDCK